MNGMLVRTDRRPRVAWLVGVAAMIGMLSGCDTGGGQRVGDRPVASAVRDPVLQDIPKPAGFALVEDQSLAVSSGRFRLAKCQYTGSLKPAEVKRFYEEYMPSAGFELRTWSLDRGEFMLRFESESEVCVVRTSPKNWSTTWVTVEIKPKAKGDPRHGAKPPMRRPQ